MDNLRTEWRGDREIGDTGRCGFDSGPHTACDIIAGHPLSMNVKAGLKREADALARVEAVARDCLARCDADNEPLAQRADTRAAVENLLTHVLATELINQEIRRAERDCERLRATCKERLAERCDACSGRLLVRLMV